MPYHSSKHKPPHSSKFEKEVLESLRRLYPNKRVVAQYQIPFVSHRYDIGFPEDKVIVECYGNYWHSHKTQFTTMNRLHPTIQKPIKQLVAVDLLREQIAKNHGYKIIVIWENEWMLKREILLQGIFSL